MNILKNASSMICGLMLTMAAATPGLAHHGWSEYDSSRELKLTGTIAESGYEHPHGHIKLVTPAKTWTAVLAPPSRMSARGLPPAALKVGGTVTVVGFANRSKPEEMRAERIIVGDKAVELR